MTEPGGTSPGRCSDGARQRRDPMIGTAPPGRRWLLVEQAGGWGRAAFASLDAPGLDRRTLADALAAAEARLQLIRPVTGRRAGHEAADATRRWAVVSASPRVRWGTLADGWDAIVAALTAEGSRFSEPEPAASPAPILLVCTNGRHDVCCAVRGRPVAAALAARYGDLVWETTHTGGDRFAANLVVLPDGACYGGLDPENAADVAAAHLAGRVAAGHLRGVTGYGAQEQAALIAAAPHLGAPPWDRARLRARALPVAAGPPAWACEILRDGAVAAVVHGHIELRAAAQLTCSAAAPSRAAVPVVDRVEQARPARPAQA